MATAKVWIMATRPRTLILSVSPVLIGTVALPRDTFDPLIFLFTLLCALGIQIGTNLANDYFDFIKGADTSERIGPPRMAQQGLIAPPSIKFAFLGVFFATALCSLPLVARGGAVIALLACVSILLGIIYTGGPYPIAHLGLSEFFIFFFFGPIATASTFYLQTGVFSLESAWIGVAPGSLSCCVVILNYLRDIRQDSLAGRKTLIVRFGRRFGEVEFTLFLALAFLVPFSYWPSCKLLSLTMLLLAIPALQLTLSLFKIREPWQYGPYFKKMGLLTCFYTLLFCLGWII